MRPGIYEQIINRLFRLKLAAVDRDRFFVGQRAIGKREAVILLSKYLEHLIERAFEAASTEQEDEECTSEKYRTFVNDVIKALGRDFCIDDAEGNLVDISKSILTAVVDRRKCDYVDMEEYIRSITPLTTLSRSALFFGGKGPADMQSELNREIRSSDEICWVVSFIKTGGLRLLWESLKTFTSQGKRLRIITTTYMGTTDYDAISRLSCLPNTEVKISYDGTQDRLHAKAYIFLRNSCFHTAYIGSSNLSHYALQEGKEWNFKATQFELPQVIEEVRNSFESYWSDDTFEPFIPGESDERLKKALGLTWETPILDFSALDLMRAKDYQQEILEKLDVERTLHHHYRNLVVAATGTGKTVIAAFDFKRFMEEHPDCHFLFIAHRQEILRQAMMTFRTILDDPNFGDLLDGTHEPSMKNHLFASKDTLRNRLGSSYLEKDYYDYIIIDEVHHVIAPTYVQLVEYFEPKILLGLTATPERTNAEEDITCYFDGHISAEIRLPAALNAGLLAPFHYYGISDNVDLSEVSWKGHGYDPAELTRIYTCNDYRTGLILRKMQEYIGPSRLHQVKALCFCVNKEHAKYMNAKFTLAGLKTDVLTSDDGDEYRYRVRNALARGEINYLFVIDMYNEGVDIPEVDTVLFLRPTESATIFLQQFGRGLRLYSGKEYLTVLDFVGHSRAEFNYKERFESLVGRRLNNITDEIKEGFPNAPFGCKIMLEGKAKEEILSNIEGFIRGMRKDRIVQEVAKYYKACGDGSSLQGFLIYSLIPLRRIYDYTWGELRSCAGVIESPSPRADAIRRAVATKWIATDSYSYFTQLLRFVEEHFRIDMDLATPYERKVATMFYFDLHNEVGVFSTLQEMFDALATDELLIQELKEVLTVLRDDCQAPEKKDNSSFSEWNPLHLHGVYTRSQIQAALGFSTIDRKSSSREGVERSRERKLEVMYVDVIKERETGSRTDYKDFAQSRTLFHWEAQNRVREGSNEAESYRRGENHMLLFVRQQAKHPEYKCRMGYTYLGEVDLSTIEGSQPMQIVWRLRTPMSEKTYAFASQYKAIG